MNHIFTISGSRKDIEIIMKSLNSIGPANFVKRFAGEAKADFLASCNLMNSESLSIEIATFGNESQKMTDIAKNISGEYDNLSVIYRYFQKSNSIAGGIEFKKNRLVSEFYFDDRESLCDVITDFLCAVHIPLAGQEKVIMDGDLISERIGEERPNAKNPPYVVDKHRIYFEKDETVCMNLEFSSRRGSDGSKSVSNSYKTYGMSDVSWSRFGGEEEIEGTLSDFLNGDPASNFTRLVPFRFACEVYLDC